MANQHRPQRGLPGNTHSHHIGHCHTTGKAQYTSKKLAKRARKHYRENTQPFRCDACGYFHLGHGYGQTREWHRTHHQSKRAQP